jgi:cytochrome c5
MCKLIRPKIVLICLLLVSFVAGADGYGIGRLATPKQVAGWDIDVRPDGVGLPAGSGSVEQGNVLYEEKCAVCHGDFGEGTGRWPILAGGLDSLTDDRPEKTVGSYWPYVSTLWDYIHRAMPFFQPQSLSDDQVYALTAYVLYLNDLVEDDFVLSQANLTTIRLPNEHGFYMDDRPDIKNPRCMVGCRDAGSIDVLFDSTKLGVSPVDHLKAENSNPAKVANTHPGEPIYKQSCAVCHDNGIAGAPIVGDQDAWRLRLQKQASVLINNALNGFQGKAGYMPAKGGNTSLSGQEVENAVRYMLQRGR